MKVEKIKTCRRKEHKGRTDNELCRFSLRCYIEKSRLLGKDFPCLLSPFAVHILWLRLAALRSLHCIPSGSSISDRIPALHFTGKMQSSGKCLAGEWKKDAVWIIPRPIIPLTSLRPCPSSGGHLPFALVAAGRAAFFVVQFFLVEAGRASFVAVQFFLFAAVRDPDSGAAPIRGKQGQSRSIRIKNENTPTAD